MTTRDFDLVLFGATGFTGRLVAEILVEKKPSIRWALAGRNKAKLEEVRRGLARIDPAAEGIPILEGDALDAAQVEAMVRRTRVVCTTVGPYARYGRALVGACAEQGVHYCDLTGETHFIRAAIDAHHARAVETGARIVPCCGFDSIPSDLGVLMLHDHLSRRGKQIAEVHYRLRRASGGFSGGTVASILGVLDNARDPAFRRLVGDPYALNPAGAPRGPDRGDQTRPRRDPDTGPGGGGPHTPGRWTAPFIMAAINTRIVRRSNALLGFPYGEGFRYDEAMDTGRGPAGLLRATAITAAMGAFVAVAVLPPGRALLHRFLPAPGEGPSREQRERGSFHVELHAVTTSGEHFTGIVEGHKDPGYGGTAIMLSQAALCLAQDSLSSGGGVLTTASAMGMTLVERLRNEGMTFRVA